MPASSVRSAVLPDFLTVVAQLTGSASASCRSCAIHISSSIRWTRPNRRYTFSGCVTAHKTPLTTWTRSRMPWAFASDPLEHDVLRAAPQRELAERHQILPPFGHRQEMVAGELSDLARERHRAVGQQDLGLADSARIKDDVPGRGMAGVVFVSEPEIEVAERDPAAFAAPAHVDDLLLVGQQARELGAGLGRERLFHLRFERIRAGFDAKSGHDPMPWRAIGGVVAHFLPIARQRSMRVRSCAIRNGPG